MATRWRAPAANTAEAVWAIQQHEIGERCGYPLCPSCRGEGCHDCEGGGYRDATWHLRAGGPALSVTQDQLATERRVLEAGLAICDDEIEKRRPGRLTRLWRWVTRRTGRDSAQPE